MKILIFAAITSILTLDTTYDFKLNLQPGEEYKYIIKYSILKTTEYAPIDAAYTDEKEFTVTVTEATDLGVKLRAKCDWEKTYVAFGGYGMEYDSREKDDFNFMKSDKVGKFIELSLTSNGKVSAIQKATVKGKKGTHESLLDFDRFIDVVSGAYPGKAVKIGDSWKDSIQTYSKSQKYFINTYKLDKIDKGFIYITLTAKIGTAGVLSNTFTDDESSFGSVTVSTTDKEIQKGVLIFNYKTGGLVKAEIQEVTISDSGFVPIQQNGSAKNMSMVSNNITKIDIELINW